MQKRKTVNVVKPKGANRGCWILFIPIILVCMLIPLCLGFISLSLVIGLVNPADVIEAQFVAERGDAESANVAISAGLADVTLSTDSNFSDLFSADISYIGSVNFSEGGDTVRSVRLEQLDEEMNVWDIFNIFNVTINDDLNWDLLMHPTIPTALEVDGGVGELNLDLSETTLTTFNLDLGVGEANINLPVPQASYDVEISGGVGDITLTLPDDVAVRIDAEMGVGDINIENNSLREMDDGGRWQTDDYGSADQHITIVFEGGVGEFTVR